MAGAATGRDPYALERPYSARTCVVFFSSVLALGALVSLLGWMLDEPVLTDWLGTGISVQPNGALVGLLSALALLAGAVGMRIVAAAVGGVVTLVAGATLVQHLTGADFGIDNMLGLYRPWGDLGTMGPGRMGVPSSVAFIMVGLGIVLAQFRNTARHAPLLGLLATGIAAVTLTGYLFDSVALYSVPRWTAISVPSGFLLVAGGLGVVASAPAWEPMRTLIEPSSAGVMVRQTLPFVVAITLAVAWLRALGENVGLYGSATGGAMLVVTLVSLLCIVLWRGADVVRRRERELTAARRARVRADSARRESEGRSAALLENLPDAFASFDAEWHYTYLNGAAERAMGKTRSEVLGRRLWDVFPQVREGELGVRLRKAARTGVTEEFDEFNPVVGRWFGIRAYATPDGGVAVYFRDLTESRRAEAELKLTTDHAEVMLAHIDVEGRFLFVNAPYAARFGLAREEVIGRTAQEVMGESAYARFAGHVEEVLAGQSVTFDLDIPFPSGESRFMHVAYTPERDADGRVVGLVAALIDITERRRAEDALREADRRKDAFLATLSHELRNPLAPIFNCIEILRRGIADPEQSGRVLATLERQVRHMVRLVDDLLDINRISRDTLVLRREAVHLRSVVLQAIEAFQPQADAKEQSVAVHVDPSASLIVEGDRVRLVQILGNLLSNAGRYSGTGGHIAVNVRKEATAAIITVTDDGIGIDPAMLDTIFGPFTQLDAARAEAQGGLGIGLTLARRLAELHGGTLRAFSEGKGCGSRFVLSLPCL